MVGDDTLILIDKFLENNALSFMAVVGKVGTFLSTIGVRYTSFFYFVGERRVSAMAPYPIYDIFLDLFSFKCFISFACFSNAYMYEFMFHTDHTLGQSRR